MPHWIITYPAPATTPVVRLVCLPYAGGTAAAFRPWRACLPKQVELCAVAPPLIGGYPRSRGCNTVETLADVVATACEPLLDRPYALFGHSLGAALAYEVSHRLEDAGRGPDHLYVSARRAPQVESALPRMAHLPDDQFIQQMQERYGGVPNEVLAEPDVMALLLPKLRADVRMNEQYASPARRLRCPISALGGAADLAVSAADLDAWSACTASQFRRHLLPGGHFFMRESPAAIISVFRETWLGDIARSGATA